ncbi:glycerate kinase [Succinimonas sp.]|uniref:glycerate kinase family protein n=1 Tax=Succinimonas sp. TaxID=1936151 RepID=UPI003870BE45
MNFLFVSDSFKGSLTSQDTAELLTRAAREVFGADTVCQGLPVADGGEGTITAIKHASGGEFIAMTVTGAAGNPVTARYLAIDGKRAVIEMAEASGLTGTPPEKRNPLYTTSRGTGELLRDALRRGFTDIAVSLGGSATNDGGMGALIALGAVFRDEDGNPLSGRGADLIHVREADFSGLDPRLQEIKLTVMNDVRNPLTGPRGATMTYGPQKGGTPEILARLEQGMRHYREIIIEKTGRDPDALPGAGAAGGLGAALGIILRGEMRSGIDTVLDLLDFDARLKETDLVVTGEGRTDSQTASGKVMQAVGERCRKHGVPAAGLSGSMGDGAMEILDHGISSLMTSVNAPMSLDTALMHARELYYDAALRMFLFIRTGMEMGCRGAQAEQGILGK